MLKYFQKPQFLSCLRTDVRPLTGRRESSERYGRIRYLRTDLQL